MKRAGLVDLSGYGWEKPEGVFRCEARMLSNERCKHRKAPHSCVCQQHQAILMEVPR